MQKNFEVLTRTIVEFEALYGRDQLEFLKERPMGRHFAEFLLLGMIQSTPKDSQNPLSDAQRLSTAHAAIYGVAPITPANMRGADYRALTWMAEIREMQLREKQSGCRSKVDSDLGLARRAAAHHSNSSSPNHLRIKFPLFLLKRRDVNIQKQTDVEVIQRLALDLIEDVFTLFGVSFYAEK